jgi:hypothetical protein
MVRRVIQGFSKTGTHNLRVATFAEPAARVDINIPLYFPEVTFTVAKTSPIDWKSPTTFVIGILTIVLTVALGSLTIFFAYILPDKITAAITTSPAVLGIRSDLQQMNQTLGGVDKRVGGLETEVKDKIEPLLPALRNPTLMIEAVRTMTSTDRLALAKELPEARKLLLILRESKRTVPSKVYREISIPLNANYKSPAAALELKDQIWLTLEALASTKSTTDSLAYTLPEAELKRAKESGRFFDGGERDLSDQKVWKDTIFQDCTIKITKPSQGLILSNVRFVNVDFQGLPQNSASHSLLGTIVNKDGSNVSGTITPIVGISYKLAPPSETSSNGPREVSRPVAVAVKH